MQVWLSEKDRDAKKGDRSLQYDAGQCLMCGCCLEICPNYTPESTFSGAASMIHAFKILEQNKEDIHLQKLKENYEKYFFAGCSQSLSCVKICPLGLPLDRIQSRANHHLRETKNEKFLFPLSFLLFLQHVLLFRTTRPKAIPSLRWAPT